MEKFVPPVSHFPTEDFFLRWKILRSEKKFRGRKKQHKNEKQTQGREEQRSSLPWVICDFLMNASSIFFLLILLCKNRVQSLKKVAVKKPMYHCGRW